MKIVFRYIPARMVLEQQPPKRENFPGLDITCFEDVEMEFIQSKKCFPVSTLVWPSGDLIEGKDFELIEDGISKTFMRAKPLSKEEPKINIDEVLARSWNENLKECFPEAKEATEADLWREVESMTGSCFLYQDIEDLENKFEIKRK